MSTEPPQHWPKSFLRNQGQLTRAQRAAWRDAWPTYGVHLPYGVPLVPEEVFGRSAPLTVDIGFGKGLALHAYAKAFPERDVLGVEVHRPGLGAALTRLQEEPLPNVRLVRHDALRLLRDHLPPHSVHRVHLFFPEPWPPEDKAPRRLMRPLLLDLLHRVCVPGAELVFATDVAVYAEEGRRRLREHAHWEVAQADAPRPSWRPITKYEAKGMEAGRTIHDVVGRHLG